MKYKLTGLWYLLLHWIFETDVWSRDSAHLQGSKNANATNLSQDLEIWWKNAWMHNATILNTPSSWLRYTVSIIYHDMCIGIMISHILSGKNGFFHTLYCRFIHFTFCKLVKFKWYRIYSIPRLPSLSLHTNLG